MRRLGRNFAEQVNEEATQEARDILAAYYEEIYGKEFVEIMFFLRN
jgi:hypothetical protein